MRKRLIRFLLWLARLVGWEATAPTLYIEEAKFVVREVESKFPRTSGEFKRAQALRMMLNITGASERKCAKAIEEAVELCLPR